MTKSNSGQSKNCVYIMAVTGISAVLLGIGISVLISELNFEDNAIDFKYNEIPCVELHFSSKLFKGEISGPESMAYVGDDKIISGMDDGRVMELDINKNTTKVLYTLKKSRPLGMRVINETTLVVADAVLGLYSYNFKTKEIVFLIKAEDVVEGMPVLLLDDVAYSQKRNMLYVTQISVKYGFDEGLSMLAHGGKHGRVLTYNFNTREVNCLSPRFAFTNGIEIDRDEKYLLINEFSRFTTHKYDLNSNELSEFARFSGLPDNIRSDGFDGYWVGVNAANKPSLYYFQKYPIFRFIFHLLIESNILSEEALTSPHGSFMHINRVGNVDKCFYSNDGRTFNQVSEVLQLDGLLFVGSFLDKVDYIAQIEMKDLH